MIRRELHIRMEALLFMECDCIHGFMDITSKKRERIRE